MKDQEYARYEPASDRDDKRPVYRVRLEYLGGDETMRVAVRDYRPDAYGERNLILSSWLLDETQGPCGTWLRDGYFETREPYLKEVVIPRSKIVVAVLSKNEDAIVGWMASENGVPLALSVKPKWRLAGKSIAAQLLKTLETP